MSLDFKNKNFRPKKYKTLRQLLNAEQQYLHHTCKYPFCPDSSIEAPPSLLPKKKYCDITGLQSKYTDPQTKLQYRSFEEYQLLKSNEIPPALVHGYLELRRANVVLK